MHTATPTFYMYELDNWNDAIDVHITEIGKTVNWLREIAASTTIPEININAEKFLNQLSLYRKRKKLLLKEIESLEAYLFENKVAYGKEHITAKTRKRQEEMRLKVYTAEKDYLNLIFNCNSFLGNNSN